MMERFDMLIFFGQNQNAAYDQLIWKIAIQVNITINNIFVIRLGSITQKSQNFTSPTAFSVLTAPVPRLYSDRLLFCI